MKAAGDVKETVMLILSGCSYRATSCTGVKVLQTKLTSMDVIVKEGMLYLQGVKFVKVCSIEILTSQNN